MSNLLKEIYDGWKNLVFENEEVEKLAKERIKQCAGFEDENNVIVLKKCDHFSDNKICGKCGCYMPAKARSPRSSCPIGNW
jgi:hypothetical protein